MSILGEVTVAVSVVLGSTQVPIRQVLKMGRGAMIPFDCGTDDPSELHVNGIAVAHGRMVPRLGKRVTALRMQADDGEPQRNERGSKRNVAGSVHRT